MKIEVIVKAGSKVTKVEKTPEGIYRVHVKAPAHEGKANEAVIEALSEHFHIPKRAITLAHGRTSRRKIIHLAD